MTRLREHVHGTDGGEGEAVRGQILAVAGKRRGVARKVDNALSRALCDCFQRGFFAAFARGIEHDGIHAAFAREQAGEHILHVAADKLRACVL